MLRFNLIDNGWITCMMLVEGGPPRELSLKEVLIEAARIREVVDPSPLITVSLHRLLLAILHRNFGPKTAGEWGELWNAGRWDGSRLKDYFDRWHDRFDLFHERHPFYQTNSLSFRYASAIAKLAHELASGNNATLFDHTTEAGDTAFTPAQAARCLVAFQAFALGGLVSFEEGRDRRVDGVADAAPLVKGAVGLVKGDNLFSTLMLNLHRLNEEDAVPFSSEGDSPAWERDEETLAEDRRPRGHLDLLTWQSRRIRLQPQVSTDGQLVVKRVVIMKGSQFPDHFTLHGKETMVGFKKRPKAKANEDPWPAVGFQIDRAIWRDSLALFQTVEDKWTRPKMLGWLDELVSEGLLSRSTTIPMDFFGIRSDKAKALFWRHERLPLNLTYLDDRELLDALGLALDVAERTARTLTSSTWTLAKLLVSPHSDRDDARQPDRKVVAPVFDALNPGRLYWSRLEVQFKKLLVDLVQDKQTMEDGTVEFGSVVIPLWADLIGRTATSAFEECTTGLDGSQRTLRAVAIAEVGFRRLLGAALKDYPKPVSEVIHDPTY